MGDNTILFLAANPNSSGRLSLDEEARDIEGRIQLRTCSIALALRTCWAVRPGDLLTALNQDRPAIVHFSGHGSGAAGLVLHDDSGQAKMVKGAALQRLFKAHKNDVRIVVLNACYSEHQARLIRKVVDCVIGMSRSIGDLAARIFAAAFYQALGHGRNVQNAFDQALAAIDLEGLGEEDIPRLLVRRGVIASNVFLRAPSPESAREEGLRPVKSPATQRRCVITLRASLKDLDAELVGRLTGLLREHARDMTLQIETIEDGSVRLTIVTTESGRANLLKASRQGRLSKLAGLQVLSVVDAESEAQLVSAVQEVARASRMAGSLHVGGGLALVLADPQPPDRTSSSLLSDAEMRLARAMAEGDARSALPVLIDRYGPPIYAYCRRILAAEADADDVTQTVFMQAFEALNRGTRVQDVRVWLLGITRNRCLDRLQYRRRAPLLMDAEDLGRVLDHVPTDDLLRDPRLSQALEGCLDALDVKSRTALLLRYQDQLSYDAISRLTGERPGALRVRVARALPALRRCLEKRGLP